MNIKTYIQQQNVTQKLAIQQLANKLGVSEITVKSWAYGCRHPRREKWRDIEAATDGLVTVLDLI
jgi:DNA-binding transcriptional regulator YdaS (Cro superfamily)